LVRVFRGVVVGLVSMGGMGGSGGADIADVGADADVVGSSGAE
jgi:phage tail tape-measure protein